MKTVAVLVCLLAVAPVAAAEDLFSFAIAGDFSDVDPSLGAHSLALHLYTDAAGTPAAEVLVDGVSPIPTLP